MGAPELHDSEACTLAWQTLRLAHDRVAGRLGAALGGECGLAINEFDVLIYLRAHAAEEVRAGALLDAVALSQPALSRLVARLEARGLVARSPAAADGRATVVCLTDAGAVPPPSRHPHPRRRRPRNPDRQVLPGRTRDVAADPEPDRTRAAAHDAGGAGWRHGIDYQLRVDSR